jgi:hypothetical protein
MPRKFKPYVLLNRHGVRFLTDGEGAGKVDCAYAIAN